MIWSLRHLIREQNYILKTKNNNSRHKPQTGATENPIRVMSGDLNSGEKTKLKLRITKSSVDTSWQIISYMKALIKWAFSNVLNFRFKKNPLLLAFH